MAMFVLLHGAWQGGWCFDRLGTALAQRGHQVLAPDLPVDSDAGLECCAATVSAVLPDDTQDVVLVGHSLAGLIVPIVAARAPVRHMVVLAGFLSSPGESMNEVFAREHDVFSPGWAALASRQRRGSHGSSSWPADAAIEAFYHDCSAEDADWAARRLHPQCWRPLIEPNALVAWPDTPGTYVLCRDDRVINPGWSRRAALERLGAAPVELEGGHSPFLSRPDALADVLEGVLR